MSQNVTFNGIVYSIPELGDWNWGQSVTDYLIAISSGVLQKIGGSFHISNEIDFGGEAGIKSSYYKSRSQNVATIGTIRLASSDVISFRNQSNTENLIIGINSDNQLTFNGIPFAAANVNPGVIGRFSYYVDVSVLDDFSGLSVDGENIVMAGGSFRLSSGSVNIPSLSFSNDTNSGIYSVGNDNIGFVTNGQLRWSINPSGILVGNDSFSLIQLPNGSANNPAFSFSNSSNSGWYLSSGNIITLSSFGTPVMNSNGSAVFFNVPAAPNSDLLTTLGTSSRRWSAIYVGDGSSSNPSFTFGADLDTGFYRLTSDTISITCGGSTAWNIGGSSGNFSAAGSGVIRTSQGSAASPSLSFVADSDTGIYIPSSNANTLCFSTGGVLQWSIDSTGSFSGGNTSARICLPNGTASVPSLSFLNDSNSGIYSVSDDNIGFSTGGYLRWTLNPAGVLIGNTGTSSIRLPNGSVSAPSLSFSNSTDSGWYLATGNVISLSASGTAVMNSNGSAVFFNVPPAPNSDLGTTLGRTDRRWSVIYMANGSISVPALSFGSDTDTGIIRNGENVFSIIAGGVVRLQSFATTNANEVCLELWDVTAGGLKRVYRGDANSGGSGYRILRILN